jgi:hypothetical protein
MPRADDRLPKQMVEVAADQAAVAAEQAEDAREARPGPWPGEEWGQYCLSMVTELARRLFPGGIGIGHSRDDGLIGAGAGGARRYLGVPSTMWGPVTDWDTLAGEVSTAGVGAAAFVVIGRPNTIGHALVLTHTSDHGIVLVNPTTPGQHTTTPITSPDPTTSTPDLARDLPDVTGRGRTVGEALGELTGDPWSVAQARALIITPGGRAHIPAPTPASATAQALTDPTHPYAGAPRKKQPSSWTAPPPPPEITEADLEEAARAAWTAGVPSVTAFTAGLRAAGWSFGNTPAGVVWARVKNELGQAAAQFQPPVPAWVTRPPAGVTRPSDQVLQEAARAAWTAGVPSGPAFTAGLRAAGWSFGDKPAVAVWARVKNELGQAAAQFQPPVPAWVTRPPAGVTHPSDQVLQEAARAARTAGVTSVTDFTAGLRAADWKIGSTPAAVVWTRVKNAGARGVGGGPGGVVDDPDPAGESDSGEEVVSQRPEQLPRDRRRPGTPAVQTRSSGPAPPPAFQPGRRPITPQTRPRTPVPRMGPGTGNRPQTPVRPVSPPPRPQTAFQPPAAGFSSLMGAMDPMSASLAERGVLRVPVPGDGDCFYNALLTTAGADRLGGLTSRTAIRRLLADALRNDPGHPDGHRQAVAVQAQWFLAEGRVSRISQNDLRATPEWTLAQAYHEIIEHMSTFDAAATADRQVREQLISQYAQQPLSEQDWQQIADQIQTPGSWNNVGGDITPLLAARVFGLTIHVHSGHSQSYPVGDGTHTIRMVRTHNHWDATRPQ